MDPTFADAVRTYLATVDVEHQYADNTLTGDPGERPCTCGDPQSDGRDRHLLEVITAHFGEPDLAPRVVHVEGAIVEDEPVPMLDERGRGRRDEDGKPVLMRGRSYVGPTNCPDCQAGLTSRGFDQLCMRVSRETSLRGCHDHCLIACGMTEASNG